MLDHIATPPIRDTGFLCILRSPGISTSPSFLENAITKGTINTPIMYDITAPIIFIPTVSDNLIKIVLPSFIHIKEISYIKQENLLSTVLTRFHYQNF